MIQRMNFVLDYFTLANSLPNGVQFSDRSSNLRNVMYVFQSRFC